VAVVLGVNAVFHDPAAAVVVDGVTVAAAEEERFSRRKHGKSPVPFSTWELPERAIRYCLAAAGVSESEIDAVAYSYDPRLATTPSSAPADDRWEGLRTLYAERAPLFLRTLLPAIDPQRFHHVPHHLAHAASAWGHAPFDSCAVMVLDGRGERGSYLAGVVRDSRIETLARQDLPHSLGLRYEELTEHLGYRRSSDEYKVMAMASYGRPAHLGEFRRLIRTTGDGGFVTEPVDWAAFSPAGSGDGAIEEHHVDLASTLQTRLEEVLLELAGWLHDRTGERFLALAGGVALNCVANSRVFEDGPFEDLWVQPASGDAGTALGAALHVAAHLDDAPIPPGTTALGPEWDDDEIAAILRAAAVPHERPDDIGEAVADVLAADGIVAWFQGRSEFGPRALGHRSLLAHPGHERNLERLNDVKGREQFRPVAPMVLLEAAKDAFEGGPIPSPYMLFTHRVRNGWAERIPAVVHVDGTARVQTVDAGSEPLVHRMLTAFRRRTGLPLVVNTSLNTAGRPMVDHPRDALECFGSAPIDALAIGPFLVRRAAMFAPPAGGSTEP
jgi:carbamoyltransferase